MSIKYKILLHEHIYDENGQCGLRNPQNPKNLNHQIFNHIIKIILHKVYLNKNHYLKFFLLLY